MNSLYERLGGSKAIDVAVDNFYRKVLQDSRVKNFFTGVDMNRQIAKQKGFLTMVLGGPNNYTGKSMRDGHKHLALEDEHFNTIVEILGQTLQELGVSEKDIHEVASLAESVRADILNR